MLKHNQQDAIRKGLEKRKEIGEYFNQGWKVPYLHLDPADLGRQYERLIRINSQSGKGGVVYILENEFGIYPPKSMHPEIGRVIQRYLDATGGEIDSTKLESIFHESFVNVEGPYKMEDYHRTSKGEVSEVSFNWFVNGEKYELTGTGNGPLSAVVHALKNSGLMPFFKLEDFTERTRGTDADAQAMAFVGIRCSEQTAHGELVYGAGENSNLDKAAIAALVCALNRAVILGAHPRP